ncbi:MAG: TIGR04551 family protein [Archangiaceae bacterium]|nr:TIGR04551 family protein [Archangiaceae bacterium]
MPDGYLRIRPELLYHMDLGRGARPERLRAVPRSPASSRDRTEAGVNMRFRFEPTFNVSEEVRIRTQIDMLDNVMFGSTPDYAFSRGLATGYAWDRDEFGIFSQSQQPPQSGVNALTDSIRVKRLWGEVSTPVGILRFGRMGSHWGTGMLHNDGNCLDCDLGDTVDRIMFVAEPVSGWYITPMIDFNVEGPQTTRDTGAPVDLSNSDDAHSLVIAAARRDTESQAKAKINSGGTVVNFGVHFTYRWQKNDPQDYYGNPFVDDAIYVNPPPAGQQPSYPGYVQRSAHLYIPDVWFKIERKEFRIELEFASILGDVQNRAMSGMTGGDPSLNQSLGIIEFGGVLQGEVRLLDNALKIGVEVGFASGDVQSGFGNHPRRKQTSTSANPNTVPGDIDGRQYACETATSCSDSFIRNFRFNRAYSVDMILFRELLGGVTDALYIKPKASYRITDGFNVFAALIYSRAIYAESTPSAHLTSTGIVGDANLGIEINAGARYETEDGFFGEIRYGILIPLPGLANNTLEPDPVRRRSGGARVGSGGSWRDRHSLLS